MRVLSGVAGPQDGKDLSQGAEVLFHLTFADAFSVHGEVSGAHAMRKKLEKGDGIADVREVGVQFELGAEAFPLGPVGTVRCGITGRDPGSHCCPDRTVVSADCSADVRGTCRHKAFCGCV